MNNRSYSLLYLHLKNIFTLKSNLHICYSTDEEIT